MQCFRFTTCFNIVENIFFVGKILSLVEGVPLFEHKIVTLAVANVPVSQIPFLTRHQLNVQNVM